MEKVGTRQGKASQGGASRLADHVYSHHLRPLSPSTLRLRAHASAVRLYVWSVLVGPCLALPWSFTKYVKTRQHTTNGPPRIPERPPSKRVGVSLTVQRRPAKKNLFCINTTLDSLRASVPPPPLPMLIRLSPIHTQSALCSPPELTHYVSSGGESVVCTHPLHLHTATRGF